jgi:streptogramin lyase
LVTHASADAAPNLLVTSQFDHTVKEYDGTTGAYLRNAAAGIDDPVDAIIGPDGNLLVADARQNVIQRFHRSTGAYLGDFASVTGPQGMTLAFGKVYVCQGSPDIVRSFDAVTGADLGSFVPANPNPFPRDVKAAHGRLYVAHWNLGAVETFDPDTHASQGLLVSPGSGGLSTPSSMAFGFDGTLYVSTNYFVNRYDAITGEFLGRFVDTGDRTGQRYAEGIAWGPDGHLYIATQNTPGVQRYHGLTGAFIDDFVPASGGGLTAPFHISFTEDFGPPLDVGDRTVRFALGHPIPNPARGVLRVPVALDDSAPATLVLYDVAGREIAARPVGGLGAGRHSVTIGEGTTLPAGVYLLRLVQSGRSVTKRAVVIR